MVIRARYQPIHVMNHAERFKLPVTVYVSEGDSVVQWFKAHSTHSGILGSNKVDHAILHY